MSIRDIPLTYEDYKALSASTDDRYELIDGEIFMVPAPTVAHQVVSRNLSVLLQLHVRAKSCGLVLYAPVDVVLGAGARRSVVQPDVLFVANERLGLVTKAEVVGAPDLVVEILSPGTAERIGVRRRRCMRAIACASTGSWMSSSSRSRFSF